MSLRSRLLVLFAAFAVAPLCALGIFNHVQTMRALEALLARQTQDLAERAAGEIADRHAIQQSDLLLLAENLETQRLMGPEAARDPAARRGAMATAEPYLAQLWRQFSPSYHGIELREAGGAVVHRLGEEAPDDDAAVVTNRAGPPLRFDQPIIALSTGQRLGSVVAWPRSQQLLSGEALAARFGSGGYTLVVERATGRILYHPRHAQVRQTLHEAFGIGTTALRSGDRGDLRFQEDGRARVASFVHLEDPAWTVLATTAIDEFAPPFTRMRTTSLFLLVLVALLASSAFVLAIRRATRSLAALTRATDAVGRGDFAPALPPAGRDEVGRLAAAFGLMTTQVREMMAQMERSQQMAAIGEFAAEIAHEIRNPLTSVKLNLQRIERRVRAMKAPEIAGPLAISMREIDRLERVVRGVLHLGRRAPPSLLPCSLHATVAEAVETVRPEAERQGVLLDVDLAAGVDHVRGDAGQLRGALLNLLLNAVEAMPDGGSLRVATALVDGAAGADRIVVSIADDGPGIAPAERDRLFRPFHTTKPHGTGLGLAMALRTVEEHGGTLSLEPDTAEGRGAVFRLELPLATEAVRA